MSQRRKGNPRNRSNGRTTPRKSAAEREATTDGLEAVPMNRAMRRAVATGKVAVPAEVVAGVTEEDLEEYQSAQDEGRPMEVPETRRGWRHLPRKLLAIIGVVGMVSVIAAVAAGGAVSSVWPVAALLALAASPVFVADRIIRGSVGLLRARRWVAAVPSGVLGAAGAVASGAGAGPIVVAAGVGGAAIGLLLMRNSAPLPNLTASHRRALQSCGGTVTDLPSDIGGGMAVFAAAGSAVVATSHTLSEEAERIEDDLVGSVLLQRLEGVTSSVGDVPALVIVDGGGSFGPQRIAGDVWACSAGRVAKSVKHITKG